MKRGANVQITQENLYDDDESEAGNFKKASEEILQKRM